MMLVRTANSSPGWTFVLAPVVSQLIARFLPRHALLDPLVAAAMLLPGLARAVQRQGRIGHFLHTLVARFGQPQLDGLGLGARHGLHQAQQGFGGGHVGKPLLAVGSEHLQLVTACHQLTAFLIQPALELVPVLAGSQIVGLLGQHLHDVNDRKPPSLRRLVIHAANGLAIELGWHNFHGVCATIFSKVCSSMSAEVTRWKPGGRRRHSMATWPAARSHGETP